MRALAILGLGACSACASSGPGQLFSELGDDEAGQDSAPGTGAAEASSGDASPDAAQDVATAPDASANGDDAGTDAPQTSEADAASGDDGAPDALATGDDPGEVSAEAGPDGAAGTDATLGGPADASQAGADGASVVDASEAAAGDDGAASEGAPDAAGQDDAAPLEAGAEAAVGEASADGGTADGASDGPEQDAPEQDATLGGGADAGVADAPLEGPMDAGGDAATIVPVLSGGHYVYTWGRLLLEIDPQTGGRIVTFSYSGQNVLTGPSANAINYGSTFWTSPQTDWGWPPLPAVDNLPYTATVSGGTLTLQGAVDGTLGVSIAKVFSIDAASGAVDIAYTITNAGASARSFAPWEITRVRTTGLMFFPTGTQAYSADSGPSLPTSQAAGATWFDADTAGTTADTKFFANAARGWVAQAAAGLLFVKKFPDVAVADQAPGEAEVEMFASGDRAYVELEEQGAYAPVPAGGSVTWSVRWFLQALPQDMDAGLETTSFVAMVDAL